MLELRPHAEIGLPDLHHVRTHRAEFDRDVTLQFRITCAIHLAHSALAQESRNLEGTKSCTYI
jgi:hypothetical protein